MTLKIKIYAYLYCESRIICKEESHKAKMMKVILIPMKVLYNLFIIGLLIYSLINTETTPLVQVTILVVARVGVVTESRAKSESINYEYGYQNLVDIVILEEVVDTNVIYCILL